jgi:SEC-C motif
MVCDLRMNPESKSPNEGAPQREPVKKADGVTVAEKYLARLCEKNFLSLWSYPGVYRDQGNRGDAGDGKEICDLLVVFGQHIIIFSDKHCQFQDSGDVERDWQRWFKKAIQKSAEQAWGAERWIRQQPHRIFLDRECKHSLPIELPQMDEAIFHLVVVAHGASSRIRRHFTSDSGSVMLNSSLKGFEQHRSPFYVGDIAPQKTFIHVLDDDSLHTLMATRDTISDFIEYLSKRQKLLRGQPSILATGEEQLLAIYLTNLNNQSEHDFVFPTKSERGVTHIILPEGHWEDFQNSPQRIAQIDADKVSYAWDELIEKFNYYAMRGEQHFVTDGGLKDCEKILRFMAREPRWKRRYLAKRILDMIFTTPVTDRNLCVLPPREANDPYYVFLLLPMIHAKTNEEYRNVRRQFLEDCCLVTKLVYPEAKDIVGIATETDATYVSRSEDSIYFDAREWNAEMESEARVLQKNLGILTKPTKHHEHAQEFPDVPSAVGKMKNPRNKPCPCGSGKKYKHCCLNR